MSDPVYNVLFLCTGNSARSILAEAILNHEGKGRFQAFSAGSHPKGQVHPYSLKLLESLGYDTGFARSKNWEEFAEPGCANDELRFHGLRPGSRRGLPHLAGPADDGALGRGRSGRRDGNRSRDSAWPSRKPTGCCAAASWPSPACRLSSIDRLALKPKLDEIGKMT